MIAEVIKYLCPGWEAPDDNGYLWIKTLCPFHGDSHSSAAVSYEYESFSCLACGVKGTWWALLKEEGGLSNSEIKRVAESLSVGSNVPVQRKPARKPSRRVFGEPGDSRKNTVRAGIRSRTAPWT